MFNKFMEWSQRQVDAAGPIALDLSKKVLKNAEGAADWAVSQVRLCVLALSASLLLCPSASRPSSSVCLSLLLPQHFFIAGEHGRCRRVLCRHF
jgi:hypothetical protein